AMTARISGPLGTQGIFQAVEALREQVEARDADGSLPGVLDDLRADLDRAVGGLRERIDVLAADRPVGVAAEPDLEVRAQLEGLAVAVARVEERERDARPDASLVEALERLQADVEALTARPADAGPATEAVIEALAALPAQLESQPDHELRAAVASLGERIDALSGLSAPPATDDGLRDELTALREAVSALAEHADDASDLRAELDALGARLSGPLGLQGLARALEELPDRMAPH